MQLSSTSITSVTSGQTLFDDIDFLAQTDSVQYPLADKLRNVNSYYRDVVTAILESQSDWDFDDTQNSNFPIAYSTMVAGQQDYTLPSALIKLLQVEVLDAGGEPHKLTPFDESNLDSALDSTTTGLPTHYRMMGKSIELYPAPAASSVTLTGGLICYFQRDAAEFTASTAITTEPGFASNFHRILSIGPAFDFCNANGKSQTAGLKLRLDELFAGLRKHYAKPNRQVVPRITTRHRSFE